jgi:predicted aspartyl protease
MNYWAACTALFFLVAGQQAENPWKARVPGAVSAAHQDDTVKAYQKALQAAWRADDWQTGLQLARETLDKWPNSQELRGPQARALWRAGQIGQAEELAAQIPPTTTDHVASRILIQIGLSRGELQAAGATADRLSESTPLEAEDLLAILSVRLAQSRLAGLPELLRRAEKLADVANGYPETYMVEQLHGVPEFFEAVGTAPINQITQFGEADMPVVPLINLPSCQVLINGRGPYKMLVDTGGSITLALDQSIATELGLKSFAPATIHGVGGKEESGQTLVDQLTIGGITCRRVMAHILELNKSIGYAADGLIGTGIFSTGRMTLDFAVGRLRIEPASTAPAAGREAEVRIVGDGKLLTPAFVNGKSVIALIDSGADVFIMSSSRLKDLFPGRTIKTIPVLAMGVGGDLQPNITMTPGVKLKFAGRTFDDYGGLGLDVMDTLLSPMMGIQTDALLGMSVLRDVQKLTVDYVHSRMWVQWIEP